MKLVYKFIGTEADKKKFVDPEPEINQIYSQDEIDEMLEKHGGDTGMIMLFEITEVPEEPKSPHEVLNPMLRVEILKLCNVKFDPSNMESIERYVAFGEPLF